MLLSQKRKQLKAAEGDKETGVTGSVERKRQSFKITLGGKPLTSEDFDEAEKAVTQFVQNHRFKNETASLKHSSGHVSKDSPLDRLDPILENDILRVGGCLQKSALSSEIKHDPVMLSKDLQVSQLILHQLEHAGRNHMLYRLRLSGVLTHQQPHIKVALGMSDLLSKEHPHLCCWTAVIR